jgi:hypothetical protein
LYTLEDTEVEILLNAARSLTEEYKEQQVSKILVVE